MPELHQKRLQMNNGYSGQDFSLHIFYLRNRYVCSNRQGGGRLSGNILGNLHIQNSKFDHHFDIRKSYSLNIHNVSKIPCTCGVCKSYVVCTSHLA